jgi:isoleucyl-tRNA synthetase
MTEPQNIYNPIELEKKILEFWEKNKLFEKSMKLRKGNKTFSFYDGPPTANNPMGVHHAWGRTYKDLYLRFKTMHGFDTRKQPGFDCQGLWVEVGVEKELGFTTKKDIEKFGLDKFTEKCEQTVNKWVKIWIELSKKLGMWMDWDNPYLTMSDENIEMVWYFLKKCWEKNWLYIGNRSLPWCPRCGTSLSQHEVSSGYAEVTHTSVFLKFPITGKKNEFLLVYTTTPWTLPADVAAAVHPDLTYVKVKQNNEIYILAESLLSALDGSYEILEKFKGKDLEGTVFIGPLQDLPLQKNVVHKVILSDIVSGEEGTGIVHIAPGHGPEDFELGIRFKLPILCPVDESGNLDSTTDWLAGKNVKEANKLILNDLQKRGLIYKIADIKHSYPLCWRCKEELIYRTEEGWFIKASEIRSKLIKEAKELKVFPEWAQKSMLDWLTNLRDWNISRKRYYGLPLPFWKCDNGHLEVIGTRDELKKKAIKGLDQLKELHRPWIDNVVLKCPKCKKEMKRIPEVGDCWLDAGVVPFSTLNYLNDKKYWKRWFPADFVTEMHEQVRLWFYSMLFISTTLVNRRPYNSFLAHGMVLDEKGKEMHKSWGNVIWAEEALNKIGADIMRWMYCSQNPGVSLSFGYTPARDVQKTLNVLFNTAKYVQTYCDANNYKPKKAKLDLASKWIFSRLETAKTNVTNYLDELKPHLAVRELEEFFLNDFSRFYIHVIRSKVKPGHESKDKQTVLCTLYDVMLETLKLLSPFTPFLTESLYQDFFRKFEKTESIHLTDWPKPNKKLINKKLEEDMEIAEKIIEASLAARQLSKLKLRWPIQEVVIVSKDKKIAPAVKNVKEVLLAMCNTKSIKVLDREPKGEFSSVEFDFGKVLVPTKLDEKLLEEAMVRELIREVQEMRKKNNFQVKEHILLTLNSNKETNQLLKKHESLLAKEVGASKIIVGKLEGEFKGKLNFEDKTVDISFSKSK